MCAPRIGERLCVTVTRRQAGADAVITERRCGTIARVEPRLAMREDASDRVVELPLDATHLAPDAPGIWRGAWEAVHADTAPGRGIFTSLRPRGG